MLRGPPGGPTCPHRGRREGGGGLPPASESPADEALLVCVTTNRPVGFLTVPRLCQWDQTTRFGVFCTPVMSLQDSRPMDDML